MKSESKVIAELWDLVRDHIPVARRLETAISFLRIFEEYGFEDKDMQDIVDEDKVLARAYDDLYGNDEPEDDSSYDEYED
jgi:hypothetical protein